MAEQSPSGTLFGLGIGPGDPDLITVKARNILGSAPVIAYPAPEGGESLVRAIAAPHVPPNRIELAISTPMCVERFPAQEVYDRYAGIIGRHLEAGHDVALLCEGDPFLYGSFMYLFERLSGRFPVRVVPGVSSLAACAAAAGLPLVSRDEVLVVLPATLADAELEARLATADRVALMKVGRHLPKVRRALARLGLVDGAIYVERATMGNERVLPLADVGDASAPYFSMVLARGGRAVAAATAPLPHGAALVVLSPGGLATARRLQPALPGSSVHGLANRVDGADHLFTETLPHFQRLFAAGTPLVGLCAAGILVRALAPLLANKRTEPPVIAVAEDGGVAVPLLGGHHGANGLARAIAHVTGGIAAVTTGADVVFGIALDEPPAGWRIANPVAAKAIAADLLAGTSVRLTVEAGDVAWLTASGAPFAADGTRAIRVSHRAAPQQATDNALVLHPPVLAVGVGCERGCDADELIDLVQTTLASTDLAPSAVACVVSIDLKEDEPAVHAAAAALGVPARFFTADVLERETPRLASPSDIVFREVGCHGVAEGAALAAAGAEGLLLVPKRRSRRATCAVALAASDLDAAAVGRPRGTLTVVGIGPGDPGWRTSEATRALTLATDIVGYQPYLELIADLVGGQRLHSPGMTQEEARARLALDLAAAGGRVALIGSGDAGIYALATLVFELLDRENRAGWNRVALSVAPGVSALQAAAARIGAPLGHDFCAVSLSDLLTPWSEIERRLRAAADGDFVVALYNPVSQRRRTQLALARDILLSGRPADTPVALGRNLGRPGETITLIPLGELTAGHADMLTVVLVGSSRTKLIERGGRTWIYTPRGYAAKLAEAGE